MVTDLSEIPRVLESVELLEQLQLDFNITEEEYRSGHDVTGKVRATVEPDSLAKRARKKPPTTFLERIAASVGETDSIAKASGYPRTEFFTAVSRTPPTSQDEEAHQDRITKQRFDVEDLPENDTVKLSNRWNIRDIERELRNDKKESISHEYNISNFPSEQLPVVIRAELERDAREYLEDQLNITDTKITSRYEGQAIIAIEIEFPDNSPNVERAPKDGVNTLNITTFTLQMQSTFNDISFLSAQHEASNYTYDPDKKRVEWRGRQIRKGETEEYIITGPIKQLLDLGKLEGRLRGRIDNETLSGTRIQGLYDRSGSTFWSSDDDPSDSTVDVTHQIRIQGELEIDPDALSGEIREVTTASMTINDRPSEAFERLETVCRRENMKIRSLQPPANPEPAPNREGVLQITGGENREGDDQPGQMEVKSEYGNEGVVYAEVEITGEFTSMKEQSEVSAFDDSQDRLVRSDQGGLETRGKSDVEIRARSNSANLNTDLISKIKTGLTSAVGTQTGSPRQEPSNRALSDGQPKAENPAIEASSESEDNESDSQEH